MLNNVYLGLIISNMLKETNCSLFCSLLKFIMFNLLTQSFRSFIKFIKY